MRRSVTMRLLALCLCLASSLATAAPADREVVNDAGVLRWADDGNEVALFGVNYYAPHLFDYQHLKQLNLDIKSVIDGDLAHFSRMGLGVLRLHVFDREISDPAGNLVDNEHLDLLDYLIAEAKKRGIYTVLTPIAWWGTPNSIGGFSDEFSMPAMTTDPEAWKAQRRYLDQFLNHGNRYTGVAYKDDPAIPVLELINEPHYPRDVDDATIGAYIETLADAVRATGCTKPIFYNGWVGKEPVVAASSIAGCTFGWYPSGLVAGRSLTSNFLPQVDAHPTMSHPSLDGKAKIVYEFDAADIPGSYIYPALARAFRSGGAQIATQFQYDPLPTAPYNTGWCTHYLNLVYAPNQAVSFTIAGEAFRRLPRHVDCGHYPESARFGAFRVSFEEDLSEFVTDTVFMHSNTTQTAPPSPPTLERIVGCGSSSVVQYDGTGAYFLDRLAPGAWQLELYPDVVWTSDPYDATPSFGKEVSRAIWRTRTMTLALPDLGERYHVTPVSNQDEDAALATDGTFLVRPGIYLLSKEGVQATPVERVFVVPPKEKRPPAVWHTPPATLFEGADCRMMAHVASLQDPDEVLLVFRMGTNPFETVPMTPEGAYVYSATIAGQRLLTGDLEYGIVARFGDERFTFPGGIEGGLGEGAYASPPSPHVLFTASGTNETLSTKYGGPVDQSATAAYHAAKGTALAVLRLTATGFGEGTSCASLRVPANLPDDGTAVWTGAWDVVVRARSLYPRTAAVEVGLIDDSGAAFGFEAPLSTEWSDIRRPVRDLRPLWGTGTARLRPEGVTELSFIYGTWLFPFDRDKAHGLEIERIALEPVAPLWTAPILPHDTPPRLFDAALHRVRPRGDGIPIRTHTIAGMDPSRVALRIAAGPFGDPPSSISFHNDAGNEVAARRALAATCDTLVVRARGPRPYTTGIEIVLTEEDGSNWGAIVPLTTEWQAIAVPLTDLRFFAHWAGNPDSRGGEGDRVRPEDVRQVNVCFGAWLYGEHASSPHEVDLQDIALERTLK